MAKRSALTISAPEVTETVEPTAVEKTEYLAVTLSTYLNAGHRAVFKGSYKTRASFVRALRAKVTSGAYVVLARDAGGVPRKNGDILTF